MPRIGTLAYSGIDWMIHVAAELLIIANHFERLAAPKKQVGTIYLIHFNDKIGPRDNPRSMAQHYIGFTTDLDKRLIRHQAGQGSSIMRFVEQSGIPWEVVRTFSGTRDDERTMKNTKNAKRYCPVCSPSPIQPRFDRTSQPQSIAGQVMDELPAQ